MADGIIVKNNPTRITKILGLIESSPKSHKMSVGFYPKSKYITGEYVAEVAYDNEYGTMSKTGKVDIPSRPFFQRAVNRMKSEYPSIFKKAVNNYVINDKSLMLIGNEFVNKIRLSIAGEFGAFVPNAQSTIDKKGSDQPLRDTSVLIQSATFELNDNGY